MGHRSHSEEVACYPQSAKTGELTKMGGLFPVKRPYFNSPGETSTFLTLNTTF